MSPQEHAEQSFASAFERLQASEKDIVVVTHMSVRTYPGMEARARYMPEYVPLATAKGLYIHEAPLQSAQGLVVYIFLSKRNTLAQQDLVDLIPGYAPISASEVQR